MKLNALIMNTLTPIGYPVSFMVYYGVAETWLTFQEYNQNGALYADDDEKNTRHSIQVDVWSKKNPNDAAEQVVTAMTAAGFRKNNMYDTYDGDFKTFHKVIRFYYAK